MRTEFLDQFAEAGWNRLKLKGLMDGIDAEKRSIKSNLSRLSSEPREGDPTGRDRQYKIRQMKDKSSFLTEEREVVRERLGQIKINQKSLNQAKHRGTGFSEAFLAAASTILDDETISAVEGLAVTILGQE